MYKYLVRVTFLNFPWPRHYGYEHLKSFVRILFTRFVHISNYLMNILGLGCVVFVTHIDFCKIAPSITQFNKSPVM
jgi:hypothetical protein